MHDVINIAGKQKIVIIEFGRNVQIAFIRQCSVSLNEENKLLTESVCANKNAISRMSYNGCGLRIVLQGAEYSHVS